MAYAAVRIYPIGGNSFNVSLCDGDEMLDLKEEGLGTFEHGTIDKNGQYIWRR